MNKKQIQTIMQNERKTKTFALSNLQYHIDEFLNQQDKETTKNNYEYITSDFKEYCITHEITELTNDNINSTVKNYRTYLCNRHKKDGKELSTTTIDNYILRLQSFINYLELNLKKIKKLNSSNVTKKIKYLELDEIKLLIKTVPDAINNQEAIKRDKAMIMSLFTGGLRVSELTSIKIDGFYKEHDIYYLSIIGKGRAKDQQEEIAIPDTTAKLILDYIECKPDTEYLFTNLRGGKLSRQAVDQELKKIAKVCDEQNRTRISERISSHSFRHSLARHLLFNKKMPVSVVKDILRHSSIAVTSQYLENDNADIQKYRTDILMVV